MHEITSIFPNIVFMFDGIVDNLAHLYLTKGRIINSRSRNTVTDDYDFIISITRTHAKLYSHKNIQMYSGYSDRKFYESY
jgi:hypothetical protein